MRKFLLGAVGLAALAMAAPAVAADLAPAYVKTVEPFYDWSGYFLGINIGGGWSQLLDQYQLSRRCYRPGRCRR